MTEINKNKNKNKKQEHIIKADLDKVFNADGVRFLLREVSGKTLESTFLRKYRERDKVYFELSIKYIYQRSSQTVDIWGKKSISEINRYESAG